MRIEVESRIIKWGKDYVLVPSNGKLLEGLINKTIRLTLVNNTGAYSMIAKVSKSSRYGVIVYLPKRMAPTWERLHEKQLKAIIEVGSDGDC
jgi:hypothetical protein